MSIKLVDSLSPMGSFPVAEAKDIVFDDLESLQEKLDNGSLGGNNTESEFNTVAFTDSIDMGKYHLLAKITDIQSESHNIIRFSCNNFKGVNEVGYTYEDDVDVYRFDIHFNTGYNDPTRDRGITLKQHGLTLFSYPLNNPQNTSPEIKNAIRLYWDYTKKEIYVFLVEIMTSIPHCVLEYTGSGTLKEEDCFVNDNSLNTLNGTAGTWARSNWSSIPYDKLETPPIYELGGELGSKTYTSLAELGLTTPVTVGDIFNAMPDSSMAVIACEDVTEHITDVPMHYGVLTIKKSAVGRFSIDFQNSLASSPCNVKKWIGTLKGDDGTGLYWREVAYKENLSIYKSLSELGLDTTATLKDITRAMAKSSMIAIKVDAMANQSEYNNITQGTVTIYKIEDARIQAIMTEKSTGRTWIGTLGGENTITGWKELRSDPPFYRIVTQGVAGYFKFKPTSNGIDQSLRISVTDNYGGMINISGATPSGSQYKPFKCIRLSNGEYTNYDAIKVANNKMLKLFYHDGYFYLKVTTYTTCTFTGLIEAPIYVETFDEENAEQIPIRSVFDTPYNDGYADPSIIVIGDADSSDGVIKTLATLGFTSDIMTWDTGVYRLSHVGGLTNLPTEITEEKPGIRLEHYDMKKWGSNHNPNVSTYGCRQSILHYKGNVFVRYTESGASAGVLITDTGWQKVSLDGFSKKTLVTNTATLKLDITKKNSSWYGAIKLTYLYDTSPVEVEISFRSITDDVRWAVINGQKYINKITYSQDSNNAAHYTIGIEFAGTTYGNYQVDVIGDFATINSLTKDAFTGDKTAVYYAPWGKNNGVSLVSAPEDIGLTFPCTSVQLVQAMRNKFNKTITGGAIGVFNCGGKTVTITDAPSDYGLLHIECFGHDRMLIRYDGIGGSTYAGSWIGQVVGNNGTFSSINWSEDSNSFNSKSVKTVTIDLSASDLQNTANDNAKGMSLSKYIVGTKNIIKVEGYYNIPSSVNSSRKKIIIKPDTDIVKPGSIVYDTDNWYIVVHGSTTGAKGSGFVKIYYID